MKAQSRGGRREGAGRKRDGVETRVSLTVRIGPITPQGIERTGRGAGREQRCIN